MLDSDPPQPNAGRVFSLKSREKAVKWLVSQVAERKGKSGGMCHLSLSQTPWYPNTAHEDI